MQSFSPAMLEACYDFLREADPFHRWKLPDGETIEFHVIRSNRFRGWHEFDGESHKVGISDRWHSHTASIVETMAHEMIHIRQAIRGTTTKNTQHNAEFHRIADRVCRIHGFDRKAFI